MKRDPNPTELTRNPDRAVLESWLRETDPSRVEALSRAADVVRHEQVGDQVHLRGLCEISSYCRRNCAYCGIRAGNFAVERYRLRDVEILDCARRVAAFGCGTIVLQGGEDPQLDVAAMAAVVRRIKTEVGLAVTLSLGERTVDEWRLLRAAGADRYLLRFETSNTALFRRLHPPREPGEPLRRELLARLADLGYEVGSGVMVGLPGTSYADLVNDLLAFRELSLDMIGVGPYIQHPETPLGRNPQRLAPPDQVPNDTVTTCKVIALARLLCPRTNIPSTTALATVDPNGRELGLRCGANVWMPNFTPPRYRASYEIYPGKAATGHVELRHDDVASTLLRLGRQVGQGAGPGPRGSGPLAPLSP